MVDKPAETFFTSTERKSYEALAKRRGFASLRGYVRTLIEQDVQQHGETVEDDSDELDDPVESFRQAWDDAMNGRVMSREEFRRRMKNDAD